MKVTFIKLFFRSKGSVVSLLLLIMFGIISLGVGKHFLNKEKEMRELVMEKKIENTRANIQNTEDDLGLFLYYQKFAFINQTPPIAGLSIGLRKTNPTIKNITIRNIEEQKYESELMNPLYQLFGNMDFSFVLIYLFPLVIIVLCYNVASEERESGRWALILIQSTRPLGVLWFKIYFRYALVIGILLSLLVSAALYLSIPIDKAFLAFMAITILYVSFWFGICSFISSHHISGSSNLLYSIIVWVLLSVIIPAGIDGFVKSYIPTPEAYGTALKSREGYHEKWDMEKQGTLEQFYAIYPQFSQYQHPAGDSFSWTWYYAMQHMGDVEAQEDAENLLDKLRQRNDLVRGMSWLLPSIHTQLSLQRISHSDLENYIQFLVKLKNFHQEKRLKYYPNIFTDNSTEKENWDIEALYASYSEKADMHILPMTLPLVLILIIFVIWTRKNFIKNDLTLHL